MNGMVLIAIAISVLATGCAAFDATTYPVIRNSALVVSIEDNAKFTDPNRLGEALLIRGAICKIRLAHYPDCLAHEMRHCVEGAWHGEGSSTENCY